MYSAPDFVKVELMQNGVFASGCTPCEPGAAETDVNWGGSDTSKCVERSEVILGETDKFQCYYVELPPDMVE